MELKIVKPNFPEIINFNYEELKAEVEKKVQDYTGLVYSNETIGEAKKDIAALRKFTKALSDERIKIKKECLKPYEEFEKKINELSAIVNDPIALIDCQIKQFEDEKKAKKNLEIQDYWLECEELGQVPEQITLMMVFDEKWLNASTSMKSVQDAIDTRLHQIRSDITTLENLTEFGFEAKQEYLRSLDLGRAIAEGQRLADIQKRKEEFERTQAAKLAEVAAEQKKEQPKAEEIATPEVDPEPVYLLEFWAELTTGQAAALKQYFDLNGIKFGKIER